MANRHPSGRIALLAVIATTILGGCQATSDFFKFDPLPSPQGVAYGANLMPKNGSVVGGIVRVVARDDGVGISVYATALPPGSFRIVIHTTGNCSSPNAFSAGAPWSPAGNQPIVLSLTPSSDGTAVLSTRLRGYKLEGPDGLIGKSVVVHEGTGALDARPDVPNGRLACGVIGSMRTFSF